MAHYAAIEALDMSNPKRVAAGRKGGKAPYKGKKGFAADNKRAKAAGKKGALKRWRSKPPAPKGPSLLSAYPLHYEVMPSEPKVKRKRKLKK